MDPSEIMKSFSQKYKVRLHINPKKHDRCGVWRGDEITAPGRYGEIAAPYRLRLLRMRLTAVPNNVPMNKALNRRAQQAQAGGMRLHQRNGYETVWLFDPGNEAHCRLALELIRPRPKRLRSLTAERRLGIRGRLAAGLGAHAASSATA